MPKLDSDNCMVCGKEFSAEELSSLVASASYLKICHPCLDLSDPANDYAQVKNIISGYLKFSQQVSDPELVSPEIKIEPMESSIQKAVELLKKVNPNYFVGVRKIVVDTGMGYGHVSAGGSEDPTVIHINLPKIRGEIQSKLGTAPKDQQEKELVRQIALTISHEKGHVSSYKPESGFPGEAPAETEATSMMGKIDSYYNTLK
jgi:hypothetical protein